MTGAREVVTRAQFDDRFGRDPLPVLLLEPGSLRICVVNEAAVAVYGYSQAEFVRLTVADIRPPQEVAPLMTLFAAYSGDIDVQNSRVWIHRLADGSERPAHVESWPVEFEGMHCRVARIHFLDEEAPSPEAEGDGPALT